MSLERERERKRNEIVTILDNLIKDLLICYKADKVHALLRQNPFESSKVWNKKDGAHAMCLLMNWSLVQFACMTLSLAKLVVNPSKSLLVHVFFLLFFHILFPQ